MNQTVSVVIPAYNAGGSLRKCLDSVLNQTVPAFEILVVNDGSTDNTEEIARSYRSSIRYFAQENQGQGAARNAGLRQVTSRYVAFLDADDYWLPEFLETCVSFLEEHPDVVTVNTGFRIKQGNGDIIGPSNIDDVAREGIQGIILDRFFHYWSQYDHVRTGTVVMRHGILKLAGYQLEDLSISQDLEYWGYIATFGPWAFIPKVLWIGDSAGNAAKSGWKNKYQARRKLCTTVEAWQRRILPRLRESEVRDFAIVRGRVAANYAHNKILAGNYNKALKIVRGYSSSMPVNPLTRIMRFGSKLGPFGWRATCHIIRSRENYKDMKMRLSHKITQG